MTTSRIISRVFVIQDGYEAAGEPVTLGSGEWSSFMNTYAVWPAGAGDSVTIRRNITLQAGNYYVTGAVDNFGSVSVNGNNITLYGYGDGVSRTATGNSTVVNHRGGTMTIVISATNTGGPRGVAVTISEFKQDIVNSQSPAEVYRDGYRPTLGPPYVGALVWSTRSGGTATFGRYQITMPFKAIITAYAWGGGGGGGGMDAGTQGGLGAPGLYNTRTFTVNKGNTLEVFVGSGGTGGLTGTTAPGGLAGSSRINVNGDDTKSFNGGNGGRAGGSGSSGGGGGGGGASGILVNNVPVLIAGGGGGGGGAGNDGNESSIYARRDASITKNANGEAGVDFRGENGQNKNNDGGGGGGGGGGYPGGQGGTIGFSLGFNNEVITAYDFSAYAGQCGGNFPDRAPLPGEIKSNNGITYSLGGARGGGNGGPGIVILEFEPITKSAVKVAGEWETIEEAFVKVGGNWKDISIVYIKVGNKWRQINGVGQGDVTLPGSSTNYGKSNRSFS